MTTNKNALRQTSGVELILDDLDRADPPPNCPHGPTFLFERTQQHGTHRFYACSAFRDRKDCSFYQDYDAKVSKEKLAAREEHNKTLQPRFSHKQYQKRLKKFKSLHITDRNVCTSCSELVLLEEWYAHKSHTTVSNVTDDQLLKPSQLFKPLENNKTYAQFLFSRTTLDFIVDTLRRLQRHRVLCVGAPRIHEEIQVLKKTDSDTAWDSLLLDLDHRYQQIWAPSSFSRYNMFNHHFFDGSRAEENFKQFIDPTHGKTLIIMDPPFGGLVEALGQTLTRMHIAIGQPLDILWFSPYFMEKRLVDLDHNLVMLDYKVDYDNHSLFTHHGGRQHGSPVRIFTTIHDGIVLPRELGYWFCKKCARYSAPENKHCRKCRSCTSKNGQTYRHCAACSRCVKPSHVHCDACHRCDLPLHVCGKNRGAGCHICGDMAHKKFDCPENTKMRKRQQNQMQDVTRKKKKK